MKQIRVYVPITLALISVSILTGCMDGKNTLAKVGGEKITVTELENRISQYPAEFQENFKNPEAKNRLLDQIIEEKLLTLAATKQNIEKSEAFKTQMENARKQLLLNTYIQENVDKKVTVTPEEIQEYFNNNPQQFGELEQRRARHILVSSEGEAQALLAQLRRGANFATLAKENSLDTTKSNGGDLGWFSRGQLVPEFENAAFALNNKGDLSNVVKTQFGFHVIQLTDKNTRQPLQFDQVKGQIEQALQAKKRQEITAQLLDQLKKDYPIKKMDDIAKKDEKKPEAVN